MNFRAVRASLVVADVPSFERPRIPGTSNLNAFRDGLRVLRTIVTEIVQPRPVAAPSITAVPEAVAPGG